MQTSIFLSDPQNLVNDLQPSLPITKYRGSNLLGRKLESQHSAVQTYAEQVLIAIIIAAKNGNIREGTMVGWRRAFALHRCLSALHFLLLLPALGPPDT